MSFEGVMAFSNKCLLFVLIGKGIFDWQQWYWGAINTTIQTDNLW